ncbi:hypothetical protein V5F77_20890 [Xanthobacter sp. DSM 24535]|uniref:hypothetical protein n=1 Tax=Roseixanthobacter psychrophilus TaxID=3119917 RepID=UPI00372B6EB8
MGGKATGIYISRFEFPECAEFEDSGKDEEVPGGWAPGQTRGRELKLLPHKASNWLATSFKASASIRA